MIRNLKDYKTERRVFLDGYSNYSSPYELDEDTDPKILEEYRAEMDLKRDFENFKKTYNTILDDGYSADTFTGKD